MKLNMDNIQFESRCEITDVINVLDEWRESHPASDSKAPIVKELMDKLEVMHMNW